MGAYYKNIYPGLAAEKRFIAQAISPGVKVLGICLGAQLIASALGAKVYPNAHKEIGWFPINLTSDGIASALFRNLPSEFFAFHWHGDTFDLPPGAKLSGRKHGLPESGFQLQKSCSGVAISSGFKKRKRGAID